ncbi:hypothetical protein F5Y03DRAFT_321257 [Xylaria venustula]|nr:hypothetical protein F5Y03DRAFT_321257 [Xylaria venustula]
MEEAAKSIRSLAEQILPKQPYYLSLSPTRKYQIPPDEKRLDEQDVRPLQYTTFVGGEADRGVLLTRAYFTVREEPSSSNAPTPATMKVDPNKPRKKVSLKDYRSKKVEGDSPPNLEGREKPNGLSTIKEREEIKKQAGQAPKALDSRRDAKKPLTNIKIEAQHHSPSPERRKRVTESEEGAKPAKRVKVEDAVPNGVSSQLSRDTAFQKPARSIPLGKAEVKDMKSSPATNGRPASSNSALRASSPKHSSLVNGHGKPGGQTTHKRAVSNGGPVPKTIPRLLSPLFIADLSAERSTDTVKENITESRPSPRKRPMEMNSSKPQLKKPRNDRESSPGAKKRKVLPPLLSPTLPAIVMEELSRVEKKQDTPSKESGLKILQTSESSVVVRKPLKSTGEDTIHVDNKKEMTKYVVTLKYKKRLTKTIERLLYLPPGGKKKTESLKRDDQAQRESSGSVEPGTARKRPRTTADTSEALKRPKTTDTLRPSTPPNHSTAMTRIASHSSQVDTPGATSSLTPSAHPHPERQRDPDRVRSVDRQRAQRFYQRHKTYMDVGRRLKYQHDDIMTVIRDGTKKPRENVPDREFHVAVAAGIQSLLTYLYAVKSLSEAIDLERKPSPFPHWNEMMPWFNVVRQYCNRHTQLLALVIRIQGVFVNHMSRYLWASANEPDIGKNLARLNKDELEIWRAADHVRKKLETYDESPGTTDGGAVRKLIDRLGPWTTPEDLIRVALETLRHVIHVDGLWRPVEELAHIANGATGPS